VRVEHLGAGPSGSAAYARTLVVAGRGSESRIVEVFASGAASAGAESERTPRFEAELSAVLD